jgi:CheY-like chemotaxis protein
MVDMNGAYGHCSVSVRLSTTRHSVAAGSAATGDKAMSILLVDDSATQRAALADILLAAGFHDLREADSAGLALAVLKVAAPGTIDLCLTDLYMPGWLALFRSRQSRR